MSTPIDTDALVRRLDRLEEAVALLLAERYGDPNTNYGQLRTHARADILPGLVGEVRERIGRLVEDHTDQIAFTGRNIEAVREFVAPDAGVVADEDTAAAWLVGNGSSELVSPGMLVCREPYSRRIYIKPPERSAA